MVLEIVKENETKKVVKPGIGMGTNVDKNSGLTQSEKFKVAGFEPVKTNVSTTVGSSGGGSSSGGIDVSVDNTTTPLNVVPPDQDIKNMLATIKSDSSGIGGDGLGGIGGMGGTGSMGGEVPKEPVFIDVKILKGLLQTIYMAPYFIYRTGRYEIPEIVVASLDMRATQLQTAMSLFGFVDPKYIILIAFGTGFAMDMAMIVGDARELGKRAKEERVIDERDKHIREMTPEQKDLKAGLAANKL